MEHANRVNPELERLLVPVTSLHEDPQNARSHDERNVKAIAASYRRFGQQKPIVVDAHGKVIAGNGQLRAAIALGWTHLAAVQVTMKAAEQIAFAIADNRTAELADWDGDNLRVLLDQLKEQDATLLADLDFGDDLTKICGIGEMPGNADDVPEPPDEPVTRPGDLWVLGDHRLLCGDSSTAEDVDRLLDGATIQLVNTDPPYNVKVEPRSNNAIAAGLSSFSNTHHQNFDAKRRPGASQATHKKMRAKDRPLANDFVSDEAFETMLSAWFGQIARVLEPGRSFYIWGGYANCGNYPPVLKASELYFAQAIIWVKEHPVLTRKDFMGNHEWCFYGWRLGAGHQFLGPHNATDVWAVKKVNPQSMVHLTEKPVELAARAIQYSSRPGENVLDLFGGSGSTLIGCEQTGRKAYLMELDPPYCDVICQRYAGFAGQGPVREGDGKTWSELKRSDP